MTLSTMAFNFAAFRFIILAVVLGNVCKSACDFLNGSVSCLDCVLQHDLSGVKVAVICGRGKQQLTTITNKTGYFEAEIASKSSDSCYAKLLGGPNQICAYKRSMTSKVVSKNGTLSLSTPLSFMSSCPFVEVSVKEEEDGKKKKETKFGSSKTVNLHLPKEWDLAPPSFYVPPFLPIIGIP